MSLSKASGGYHVYGFTTCNNIKQEREALHFYFFIKLGGQVSAYMLLTKYKPSPIT